MRTGTPLFGCRIIQAIRRTLTSPSSTINSTFFHFNFLSTQTPDNVPAKVSESENDEPDCLSLRIEKLSKSESVGHAFRSWMGDGFPVHRGDIFHAVNRLRKLEMNRRGLEVMEWVIREKPYPIKELDYSCLLEFTIKHHGISQGEKLFSHIPSEFQEELLYNNLVIACLNKGAIRLSLAYMRKMRELSHRISHLVFNRLIILHSSPHRRKIIPKILAQMKADKVPLHVSTYNILMKIEANEHNIEGLMKVFGDMKQAQVEPNEVSYCIVATAHAVAKLYTVVESYVEDIEKSVRNNWSTYDVLIILYGYLKKEKELVRTWGIVRGLPHVRSKSYIIAIEAFGRIGLLSYAEELWLEMKSTRGLNSTDQFNSILSVYCKHGMIKKATEVFREIEANGCKPNAITFRNLALGCLKAGLVDEAMKTLELGSDTTTNIKRVIKSTPWLETTLSMIEIFAEKGDIKNSEKLFEELKEAKYTRYTFVYNTLIKAYVKAKIHEPNLLRRMILGGARPDSETYSLIKLSEQFKC